MFHCYIRHLCYICALSFVFSLLPHCAFAEYIRSDEITLEDNLEADAQIINLNRLMDNEREKTNSQTRNYLFKLVNDSSLINYIDLKYLSDDESSSTAVIILKKRLNYEDICDSYVSQTCQQTLKIVAINENDFIEIPIEIKKVHRSSSLSSAKHFRKMRAKLSFDREKLQIKPAAQFTSHLIDYPRVQLLQHLEQRELDELIGALDFSLMEMERQQVVRIGLEKKLIGARKLKVNVRFESESELLRAFEQKIKYRFRLVVFLAPNMTRKFELVNETSAAMAMELVVSVDDLNVLNLRPLDFEYPIYSVSIENTNQNQIEINDTVLEPKLKSSQQSKSTNNSIIFTLLLNDNNNNNELPQQSSSNMSEENFPFYVDSNTGVIRLRRPILDELSSSTEKLYNFGIKATYRSLDSSSSLINSNQSTSSYYNYMLPAFAKIQISLRSLNSKDLLKPQVIIRNEILSPFISRYEILNEDSNNQTLILYINDPFSVNSKLIKLHVEKLQNPKTPAKINSNSTLYWLLENYDSFFYDDKSTNLTLLNRIEFKDQSVYKTSAKLREHLSTQADRILAEVNIQFRVDFDPLLFEKQEYSVDLTSSSLVGRNLIRCKLRNRLKSIINNNKHDNVTYRLANQDSEEVMPFEIGMFDGWLRTKKELGGAKKEMYELEVIAVNLDLQKSASVKCRVHVSCAKSDENRTRKAVQHEPIRFSLFDNSPSRTQIGLFKSVCSEPENYLYRLENSAQLKICTKDDINPCRYFDMGNKTSRNLFTLSENDGYLTTNNQINLQNLLKLVNMDTDSQQEDSYAITNLNYVSVLMQASIPHLDITYPIEIAIQNIPKLSNFNEKLILIDQIDTASDEISDRCIYTYKYWTNLEAPENMISRFVRVDKSSAHLEPDFKVIDACSSSFFIYNNGCLALKWDQDEEARKCQLLRAGKYNLEFKLCYYDANKVSCSGKYNQTLVVERDVPRSKQIRAIVNFEVNNAGRLELLSRREGLATNVGGLFLSKRNGFSVYLMALLVVICVIAFVALVSFLFLFLRPRYASGSDNRKNKSSDKVYVLPNKMKLDFKKNLEISTESTTSSSASSGSRTQNSSNTPETSSNALTTSSKVSKTDDENDEIVKIQVIDDFLSKSMMVTNQQQIQQSQQPQINKFSYTNNNFSYAGSFSSIGSSSYDSQTTTEEAKQLGLRSINEQGLYSVKTASIHFNHNQPQNQQHQQQQHQQQPMYNQETVEYDLFEARENQYRQLNTSDVLYAVNNINNINTTTNNNNCTSFRDTNLGILQPQNTKSSSLKKLKKDLALKKQANHHGQNFSAPTNVQTSSPPANLIDEKLVYEYFNRKEILLNPNDVIASVV